MHRLQSPHISIFAVYRDPVEHSYQVLRICYLVSNIPSIGNVIYSVSRHPVDPHGPFDILCRDTTMLYTINRCRTSSRSTLLYQYAVPLLLINYLRSCTTIWWRAPCLKSDRYPRYIRYGLCLFYKKSVRQISYHARQRRRRV